MQQSPFDNIINIIGGLSQGNEKPMKHGFYNAFAMFLLSVCCVALYVLFLILEPFFKPLFWAVLVGSLLFPLKYSLSKKLKAWFDDLEKNGTSVFYGVAVIPINCVNNFSEYIGCQVAEHFKLILGLLSAIFLFPWIYNVVPRSFVCLFWKVSQFISISVNALISILNSYMMLTISLGYLICIYFMWTPERDSTFRKASFLVWIFFSSYLSGFAGSLRAYVFIMLQVLAVAGLVIELLEVHRKLSENNSEPVSILTSLGYVFSNIVPTPQTPANDTTDTSEQTQYHSPEETSAKEQPIGESPKATEKPRKLYKQYTLASLPFTGKSSLERQLIASLRKRSLTDSFVFTTKTDEEESRVYFKFLFACCVCVLIWKQMWLLPVAILFLLLHGVKKLGAYVGLWDFLDMQWKRFCDLLKGYCYERYYAVVPAHCRGITKLIQYCNIQIRKAAYQSVDTVSSALVIVGLILFVIFALVFICIQIYSEALVAVQVGSNILNSTMVQNSELRALLPEGWEDTVDSLLDNAYTYGREGISNVVKSVLKDGDSEKVSKVEQQILELWDRIYQSWMASGHASHMGPQVDAMAVQDTWDKFVNNLTNTPGLLDYSRLVQWLKSNTGTLTAIAGGIWAPLASNVSLLTSSFFTFASLLFCGGSAIVNFVFSSIIFFTTLFYLLTSSESVYKPIEVITQTLPSIGPKLGMALSMAINQVFRASIKMAIFYGVWTWMINNVFGANFIYIPAAFAALLGAVPFLGTWLACIPAVLDIWLVQGRPLASVMLAIAQFAPTSVLDVSVYKEISNGGHPYLTGLAIAGGIFYLGVEGAILGPLLLCCIMLVFNLSSAFMRETPLEDQSAAHNRLRYGSLI